MSNPDRGAYTPPTDQPLSFDARQPVRGRGPAPMMLFASALVLLVLVGAIFVFYRSGVSHSSGPPPVVGAPVGAIKGAAPAEAQPTDPAAGLQIYQQAEGQAAPASPNFVQPPEQPQARLAPPTPPVVTAPAPKAAPTTPVTAQPAGPVAAAPAPTTSTAGLKPAVGATAPATAPPGVKVLTPLADLPKTPPAPVAAKPAAVAVLAPKVTPPAPKTAAATPAAPKPAPAATSGAAAVQIGAFSSQALADKGWNDAAKIAPGAAAGKGKKVEAIQKDGATLYRTQVTGFSTRAAAEAFCGELKAAGKSCFVK